MERDTQPFTEARTQSVTHVSRREKSRTQALPASLLQLPEEVPAPLELVRDARDEKTDPRAEGACLFDLSPREWRYVRNAPVVGFLLVASADGTVFPRERQALIQALEQGKRSSSELFRTVCRELYRQRHDLMALFVSDTFESEQLTEAYRLIVEKVGRDEAERFKACLLTLGQKVARASGRLGAAWGWVHREERRALTKVATAFGPSVL
ncbi:MAG TPA: hypothetical protein VF815_36505 [Myxococcaceae bacterium]|jgi:tellurite resistance protein